MTVVAVPLVEAAAHARERFPWRFTIPSPTVRRLAEIQIPLGL